MGRQTDKLLERIKQRPLPADYSWNDLVRLMKSFGYELHKGGGPRRKFIHPQSKAVLSLHEPHPAPDVAKGALEAVLQHLTKQGLI